MTDCVVPGQGWKVVTLDLENEKRLEAHPVVAWHIHTERDLPPIPVCSWGTQKFTIYALRDPEGEFYFPELKLMERARVFDQSQAIAILREMWRRKFGHDPFHKAA